MKEKPGPTAGWPPASAPCVLPHGATAGRCPRAEATVTESSRAGRGPSNADRVGSHCPGRRPCDAEVGDPRRALPESLVQKQQGRVTTAVFLKPQRAGPGLVGGPRRDRSRRAGWGGAGCSSSQTQRCVSVLERACLALSAWPPSPQAPPFVVRQPPGASPLPRGHPRDRRLPRVSPLASNTMQRRPLPAGEEPGPDTLVL